MNRADVVQLFGRQHAVASLTQLRALDPPVSRDAAFRACRTGALDRVHPGVFKLGGTTLGFSGAALSLQLLCGPTAFVSGPSAAFLHGLRSMPTEPIEITAKTWHHMELPAPHRFVRTSWIDVERDVQVRDDGIHVASPLRMLFGLAGQFSQHRFERAAEDVWHKGLVTPDQAGEYLTAIRRSGRGGVLRMEMWLERTTYRLRPSQSGLESVFVVMAERVGLPTPVRQHPLLLPSGERIHLDLAWPAVRLAVEPGHSWWHGGDLRQRADQARDRACALLGWHVHRYDESATADPGATAHELLALYRRRAADLGLASESDPLR